jgi:Glycosyl transferase family 2
MKIHCIALTKNEEDIVGYSLTEAAKWADHIYVYDGVSNDATWDIVRSLASDKIIPWKRDGKVFSEGLRAEVFNAFRHLSNDEDWWFQLNVDEFYMQDLRETLTAVPRHTDFIWGIPIEYRLTQNDLSRVDFNLAIDQLLPALRYYRIDWSEPRCFRYRKGLAWDTTAAWPKHVGLVARKRILFKHYPYRSPDQIQKRLDTRRDNRKRGFAGWEHASQSFWQEKIVDAGSCHFDDGSGNYAFDEAVIPNHLESPGRRAVKLLMHSTGLWP